MATAYEIPGLRHTLPAGQDFTGARFKFVKVDASGNAILTAAAADIPVGIIQDEPKVVGSPAAIYSTGVSKVVAGAAVVAGAPVTSDANGAAISAATGNYIAGIALIGGAKGEIISVLLQYAGFKA